MASTYPFRAIRLTCIAELLFGTALVLPQTKIPAPPPPVLRTDVRLVVLDVLVTDNHGRSVPNL